MGETYMALGDGLDTLYWNPAGLVQLSSPSVGFIHNFWFQDIGTEYLAYGSPLGPLGAFAGGLTFLHAGTIDQTLEDASGNYAGTGGQSSAMSLALIGAYAQKLGRVIPIGDGFLQNVLVGASLRIVNETIADANVFGGGIDLGAIWRETEEITTRNPTPANGAYTGDAPEVRVRDKGMRLGFVAQNLGATTDNLMPMNFRAGAGYIVNDLFSPFGRGTLAADVLIPIDNGIRVSLGGEYAHVSQNTEFAARVGYKIGNEIRELDSLAGLTAGIGVAINAGLIRYQVDYAFVPYGELGTTHRASLTLGFLPSDNIVRETVSSAVVAPLPSAPLSAATAAGAARPETALPAAAAAPAENPADRVATLTQALDRLQGRIKSGLLPGVAFKRGESSPLDDSKKAMDQVGRLLEQNPGTTLTVVGYDADKALAESRAKAVARYLTMTFRVAPDRVGVRAGEVAKQPKNTAVGFEAGAAK